MRKFLLFEHQEKEEIFDAEQIKRFSEFLAQIWDKRKEIYNYDTDEEESEEEDEASLKVKQSFLKITPHSIKAKNYVGYVKFEDLELQIFPKIFTNEKEVSQSGKRHQYFNHLLYYLSYCNNIRSPFSKVDFEHQQFDDLLDIFIFVFADYTEKILSQQPYCRYEEVTEETAFMKGRLALTEYIRDDLTTGNWQRLHCNYEPFQYDNLFNQTVKYTAKRLLKSRYSPAYSPKLESIIFMLDEVSNRVCTYEDCNKVNLNRLYEDLQVVLNMCKMFLGNQMLNAQEDNLQNFCFLLPMEKVFEDFVFGFIEKNFPELNPIRQSSANLTNDGIFRIENDIYVKSIPLIIDTKYKIRYTKDKKKGVSHADMYQMVSYALKRECEKVLLLYPGRIEKVEFDVESEWLEGKKIHITALDIDINAEKENYSDIKSSVDDRLKSEFKKILGGYEADYQREHR